MSLIWVGLFILIGLYIGSLIFNILKAMVVYIYHTIASVVYAFVGLINKIKIKTGKYKYENDKEYADGHDPYEHYAGETHNEVRMSREKACQILGVSTDASIQQIKTVFHKLAHINHPDKYIFEDEKILHAKKFIEIRDAYEYLTK